MQEPKDISAAGLTTSKRPHFRTESLSPHLHTKESQFDLVCLSHLRWDFIFQRPQHLLTRFAKHHRVFYVEEPIFGSEINHVVASRRDKHLTVVVPHLRHGLSHEEVERAQAQLLNQFFTENNIDHYVLWYYTPMALGFSKHLKPASVVYDCMDELSLFKGAPPALQIYEAELMKLADVVFTGGHSLYEAKKTKHRNIHPFPSSIDFNHFSQGRIKKTEPADQASIPHPRVGFFGAIDERLDIHLVEGLAKARPDWHFVMIGPVVKIDPASLPKLANIHWLGNKSYSELPSYLSGWDVAILPFAHNESTRFISPTKTPEYLAAGKPVVSTSIRDVVKPYGAEGLVRIADTVGDFVDSIEASLKQSHARASWMQKVDSFLGNTSWDKTWNSMYEQISVCLQARRNLATSKRKVRILREEERDYSAGTTEYTKTVNSSIIQ